MQPGKLAEAASLFRENEMEFGDSRQDREKANLYRGLALLAESLLGLQKRMEDLEREQKVAVMESDER